MRRRAEKKARLAIAVTPPPKPLPPTKPPRPKPPKSPSYVKSTDRELERLIGGSDGLFAATAVLMLGKHLIQARMRREREADEHVEFQADSPEAAAALIARLDPFQNPPATPVALEAS